MWHLSFDTVTAQKSDIVNEQTKNIWWRVREVSANKQKDQNSSESICFESL